jgi:hypothetical protein
VGQAFLPVVAGLVTNTRQTGMSVLHGNCALESAARVKVFEEVALVWLIPAYLARRYRADVQPIYIWGSQKTAN